MGATGPYLIDLVAVSMTAPYPDPPLSRKGARHEDRLDRESCRRAVGRRVRPIDDDLQARRRERPRHLYEQADEGRSGRRPRAAHDDSRDAQRRAAAEAG